MTNTLKLKAAIIARGYTQQSIARLIGLSPQGFFKKLHNHTEFKSSEITKLCEILGIEDMESIFFAHVVDKKSTTHKRETV